MLSREDNARLTEVGQGTPMGATMRRYWIPALLARELPSRSATRAAASDCSTSSARTVGPRCSSAATKSADCAASTTAGNTTWTAVAWT